ncbi:dolichol-phosphate mannosyltransferase [Ulvibacter sp. MAR_2010_11]|nr:dolichol-phosphate mannosyltransferase [Ulvibacter sp. MAR_2010_11]
METTHNKSQIDISVIIPIFNEEGIIAELYQRLRKSVMNVSENYEFIFVNDGSRDGSLIQLMKIAESDPKTYYINFSRNFGHQIAVTAGLDFCNGDAVVIIDGDLQDPPELIPQLYDEYKQGFEVVYAQRRKRKGETFFKKITAKLFYRILKRITSINIPLDTGDFRLIDKKVVSYLNKMPEQNKFLRGQIAWLGFNQTYVQYDRDSRKEGKTGYTLGKMLKFALDGITGFSDKPLLFVSRLGIFISFIAFIVLMYAIYAHYFLGTTITGWTSLMVSFLFIGGIQLISVGVIGEYISRINKNILNRPLYIIEKTNLKTKKNAEK